MMRKDMISELESMRKLMGLEEKHGDVNCDLSEEDVNSTNSEYTDGIDNQSFAEGDNSDENNIINK